MNKLIKLLALMGNAALLGGAIWFGLIAIQVGIAESGDGYNQTMSLGFVFIIIGAGLIIVSFKVIGARVRHHFKGFIEMIKRD